MDDPFGIIARSMSWRVQLNGEERVLRELAATAQTPDVTIRKDGPVWVLESARFTGLTNSAQVRASATRMLESINGAAAIALGQLQPIKVGAIEGPPNPTGGRTVEVSYSATVVVAAAAAPTLIKRRADGTEEIIRPGDPVRGWAVLADRDPKLADVLRHWGAEPSGWVALYQLLEKIEDGVGGVGRIVALGWATLPEIRAFRHTANSHAILGDAGRHGVQTQKPPAHPMKLSDARALIERMIRGWLEARGSGKC